MFTKTNAKICLLGCHEFGENLLPRLLARGLKVSHIVTIDPKTAEKNKVFGYYDFTAMAKEHKIPLHTVTNYSMNTDAELEFFKKEKFDIIIQGGWQRLIPEAILKTLKVGAIGMHGSADPLPKGRGRSPINWSIIEGKDRFMLHLFLMKPGADDGDVFAVETFDINGYDDIQTMYLKVCMSKVRMLEQHMDALASGNIKLIPQEGEPSHYPKRTPEDGRIDWENMDLNAICRLVRALAKPYPGAFGTIDGKLVRIWRARPFDTRLQYEGAKYGEVIERFGDQIIINCRGGLLLIDESETLNSIDDMSIISS